MMSTNRSLPLATLALAASLTPWGASAQEAVPSQLSIGLEEAVEIALARSYRVRQARVDHEEAKRRTDEAYSSVWPRLDGSASYTRNLVTPNPFAGSSAGDLFSGLNALGWLIYNERAREDPNDAIVPISLSEYQQRQAEGLAAAGFVSDPDSNPFFVGNQFNLGLSASQILYNGAAFAGIEGAERFLDASAAGIDRESLLVVGDTARAFYGALLAQEQTGILAKSVERTRATVKETGQRVQQGILPQFALLSAEVELANLETQLFRSENQAKSALDGLKSTLGLPPDQKLVLRGSLDVASPAGAQVTLEEAIGVAKTKRPDLRRARLNIQVLEIQEKVTWSGYLPELRAVANVALIGQVPDNRSLFLASEADPFVFERRDLGFFADDYWNPSASVGLQLNWNFFDGFLTTSTLRRNELDTSRARIQLAQLEDAVHLEVEAAFRDLETALRQIDTQTKNRARAQLNYEHAEIRVREGVSSQIELREASSQLDQSRFAYRQAVHDYLVALVNLDVAIGKPPVTGKDHP